MDVTRSRPMAPRVGTPPNSPRSTPLPAASQMKAADIIEVLGLEPLPFEGGHFAETWRDAHSSAIYYLVSPGNFSAMHRVDAAEMWHHYSGAAVDMLLLHPDGSVTTPILGKNLSQGQRPCVTVPAGVWMGASTTGDWALMGTTMAPPYNEAGFELGSLEELTAQYPAAAGAIARLVRP